MGDISMKMNFMAIGLMVTIMAEIPAFAVSSGATVEFDRSPMGTVIFDGTVHENGGLHCVNCHNPEVFPTMKKEMVKITMHELKAGKFCGRCHNGKNAFGIGDCTHCHHMVIGREF